MPKDLKGALRSKVMARFDPKEYKEAFTDLIRAEEIKCDLAKRKEKNARVFAKYVLDMSNVLSEIRKVLRNGSYCVIASGYNLVSDIEIPTPDVIIQLASKNGF